MRALIVESDPAAAAWTKKTLINADVVTTAVETADAALETLTNKHPFRVDVVVTELTLRGMSGFDFIAQLRDADPYMPIMVLAGLSHTNHVVEALSCGADAYVRKPVPAELFVAQVQALMRRMVPLRDNTVVIGDLCLDTLARTATINGDKLHLSDNEYKLIERLAQSYQGPVPVKTLHRYLYGADSTKNIGVIDVFLSKIRKKIKIQSPHKSYIKNVRGAGYMLEAHEHTRA